MSEIRSRIRRRSVSSCDSPGPRVPIPPPVRERCVHSFVRRGSWYSSCASSTCSRPSCVRACIAKMSRIRRLRSITFTSRTSSRPRCCVGESSSSAMRSVNPVSAFAASNSRALPAPIYVSGSACRRCCHSAPTISAPAVRARLANSSRLSTAGQPGSLPVSTAIKNARSTGGAISIGARRWRTVRSPTLRSSLLDQRPCKRVKISGNTCSGLAAAGIDRGANWLSAIPGALSTRIGPTPSA